VEAVATDIALIDHGGLVVHGAPEALLQSVDRRVWEIVIPSSELSEFRKNYLVSNTAHRSDGVHARVVADHAPAASARPLEPTLEDAYLSALAAHRSQTASAGGAR
jgi:ABC-2 type transport system ATP-binding protein